MNHDGGHRNATVNPLNPISGTWIHLDKRRAGHRLQFRLPEFAIHKRRNESPCYSDFTGGREPVGGLIRRLGYEYEHRRDATEHEHGLP